MNRHLSYGASGLALWRNSVLRRRPARSLVPVPRVTVRSSQRTRRPAAKADDVDWPSVVCLAVLASTSMYGLYVVGSPVLVAIQQLATIDWASLDWMHVYRVF